MSEELQVIDETAPLTEEQWDRFILSRIVRGDVRHIKSLYGLMAARDFSLGMAKIQQMAGQSQADIASLSQSVMEIAETPEQGEQHG